MSEPSKSNTTTGIVKSGTGQSVNAKAVAAGDFAYGDLGSGTAGGLGNAALLDTRTILPNTRRTQISKTQLNEADHNYTVAMNQLSAFWSVKDTSSPEYFAAKQNAMQAQYKWELARNNLEEVAVAERASTAERNLVIDDLTVGAPQVATVPDLGNPSTVTPEEANNDEIVVVADLSNRDTRIRFKAKDPQKDSLYSGICEPLAETNGVVFPYTPTITLQHRAEYSKMTPTHANTDYWIYSNTPAPQIQIQGQFSAQNLAEAKYLLASMHFFRTVTKMHFGVNDDNPGLPPPVLLLHGYGEYMFNNLNVIITDFSMDMPNSVDYIQVDSDGGTAWVPSLTMFNLSCVVQFTPKQQRDDFNFNDFANGSLLRSRGWL